MSNLHKSMASFPFWCYSRKWGGRVSSRFPCVTPVVENLSPDFLRAITNYCEGTLNVGASRLFKCIKFPAVNWYTEKYFLRLDRTTRYLVCNDWEILLVLTQLGVRGLEKTMGLCVSWTCSREGDGEKRYGEYGFSFIGGWFYSVEWV